MSLDAGLNVVGTFAMPDDDNTSLQRSALLLSQKNFTVSCGWRFA